MKQTNINLVSAAKVYSENKYSEFTTLFRIPFKETPIEEVFKNREHVWKDLLGSWAEVCILALNMRMDSCVSMLFRNKDNILLSNELQVVFKKANGQIHAFNHPSFNAMERMVKYFQSGDWNAIKNYDPGIRQLLKALYWIPEESKQEKGSFGFGQLISCLEEFTLMQDKFTQVEF
jgi:hypothetical protein